MFHLQFNHHLFHCPDDNCPWTKTGFSDSCDDSYFFLLLELNEIVSQMMLTN